MLESTDLRFCWASRISPQAGRLSRSHVLQAARLEALERFRTGEAKFLLATDVAARGLDILGVDTVVNFDCPPSVDTYLHRIGRTARAGEGGLSITFVEDGDRAVVKGVVKKVRSLSDIYNFPPISFVFLSGHGVVSGACIGRQV